jgi:hypothetical protein
MSKRVAKSYYVDVDRAERLEALAHIYRVKPSEVIRLLMADDSRVVSACDVVRRAKIAELERAYDDK